MDLLSSEQQKVNGTAVVSCKELNWSEEYLFTISTEKYYKYIGRDEIRQTMSSYGWGKKTKVSVFCTLEDNGYTYQWHTNTNSHTFYTYQLNLDMNSLTYTYRILSHEETMIGTKKDKYNYETHDYVYNFGANPSITIDEDYYREDEAKAYFKTMNEAFKSHNDMQYVTNLFD